FLPIWKQLQVSSPNSNHPTACWSLPRRRNNKSSVSFIYRLATIVETTTWRRISTTSFYRLGIAISLSDYSGLFYLIYLSPH
ncbi:hypothetical protein KI387_006015, partial [Taxus chinensis]